METVEMKGCARCSLAFQKLEAFETYKSICIKNQKVFSELIEEKKANAKLSKHFLLKSKKLEECRKLISSLSASTNELSSKCKKLERSIGVSRFELASCQLSKENVLKELELEKKAHTETYKEMRSLDAKVQMSDSLMASKDFLISQYQAQIKGYDDDSEKYTALKKEHDKIITKLLAFVRGKDFTRDLFRSFRKFITSLESKDETFRLEIQLVSPTLTPEGSADTGIFSGDDEPNAAISEKSNDCLDGDVSSDDEDVTKANCTESSTDISKACTDNLLQTASTVSSEQISTAIYDKGNGCLDGDLDVSSDDDFEDVTITNCSESSTEITKACTGNILQTSSTSSAPVNGVSSNLSTRNAENGDLALTVVDQLNLDVNYSSPSVTDPPLSELHINIPPIPPRRCTPILSVTPPSPDLQLDLTSPKLSHVLEPLDPTSLSPDHQGGIESENLPDHKQSLTEELSCPHREIYSCSSPSACSNKEKDVEHDIELILKEMTTVNMISPFADDSNDSFGPNVNAGNEFSMNDSELNKTEVSSAITRTALHLQDNISSSPMISNHLMELTMNDRSTDPMEDQSLKPIMKDVSTSPIEYLSLKSTMKDASTDPMEHLSHKASMKDTCTDPIEDLSPKRVCIDASTNTLEVQPVKPDHDEASNSRSKDLVNKPVCIDASTSPFKDMSHSPIYIHASTSPIQHLSSKSVLVDASGRPVKRPFSKTNHVDSSVSPMKKLMLDVLDSDTKPVNDQQQKSSCKSSLYPLQRFVAEQTCVDKDLGKDIGVVGSCASPIENVVRTPESPIRVVKESSAGISSTTSIDSSASCTQKKSLAVALSSTSNITQCAVKTFQDASTNTSGLVPPITTDEEYDEKRHSSVLQNMDLCPSWSGTLPPESEILTFVNSVLVSNMPKGVRSSKKGSIANELSDIVLRIIRSIPANVAKGDSNGIILEPVQRKISLQFHCVGTQTETWIDSICINSCVLKSVLEDHHRKLHSLLQCAQAQDVSEECNVSSSLKRCEPKMMTHQQIQSHVEMNDSDVTCQSDQREVDVVSNDAQGELNQSFHKLSASGHKKHDSTSHVVSDLKRSNSRTIHRKLSNRANLGQCVNKEVISKPQVNTFSSEEGHDQCNVQVVKSEGHVLRSGRLTSAVQKNLFPKEPITSASVIASEGDEDKNDKTTKPHQHPLSVIPSPSLSTKCDDAKKLQSTICAERKVACKPTVEVSVAKEESIMNVKPLRRSPRMKSESRNKRCCGSEIPAGRRAKCAKLDIDTLNDKTGKETDLHLNTSKSDLLMRNKDITHVPSTTEYSAVNDDTKHELLVKEKVESVSEQDSQIPILSELTSESALSVSSATCEDSFSICSPSSTNELIIDEREVIDTSSNSGVESRLKERDEDEVTCLIGRGSKSLSSTSVDSLSPSPACSAPTTKSTKLNQKRSKLQKLRSKVSRIFPSGQSVKSPVTHYPEVERKAILEPRLPSVASVQMASAQTREEKRREERAAVLKKLREQSSVPMAAATSGRTAQLIDPAESYNLRASPSQFKSGERTVNLTPHPPTLRKRRLPQPSVRPSDRLATVQSNKTSPVSVPGGHDVPTKVPSSKLPDPDALPSTLAPPVSMITLPCTPKLEIEPSSMLSAKSTLIPSSSRPMDIVLQGSSDDDHKVKYTVGPNHKNDLKCTVNLVNSRLKSFLASTRFTPELLQETINVLGQQRLYWSPLVIARYIVNFVEDDHDTPVNKSSKKAPPLTPNQQQLITLIIQLAYQHKSMEHLPKEILQLIEYRMFRLGHAPEVSSLVWLSHMYTAICRALNLRSRALIFCWDALYAIQVLGFVVVTAVLETWPTLLPENVSFEKACPNSQVLLHLLAAQSTSWTKGRPFNNKGFLIQHDVAKILKQYKIETGGINSDILASSFVARILSNNGNSLVPALVLLSKRECQTWALNKVVNEHLYPALNRWQEGQLSEGSAEKIIWALCCILRQLNIEESHKTIEPTFKLLRSLLHQTDKAHIASPQVEEALVAGLALLSRYNVEFAAETILQWCPPYASKTGISSQLMQHLKSMVSNTGRNYNWWMSRLAQTSKASCEE